MSDIEAISIDFYKTLVYHRDGRGRGALLVEYLHANELKHTPWEHQVLYDTFEQHSERYSPQAAASARRDYLVNLTTRLFESLGVTGSAADPGQHALAIWRILGPQAFAVFPDVVPALKALRSAGYRLAVISNWQRGLRHFCEELAIARHFDHILGSADLGIAKPDPAIFHAACERLGVLPSQLLHVGDAIVDDIEGATEAGAHALHLQRNGTDEAPGEGVVTSFSDLVRILGSQSGNPGAAT